MEKSGGGTARELKWRDRLQRYSVSGQTVQAFCASEGISRESFYQWRSRLRRRGVVAEDAGGFSQPRSTFIEVGTVQEEKVARDLLRSDVGEGQHRRFEIKLDLGSGVVLHVVRS